jgi:alkaline phosphatase
MESEGILLRIRIVRLGVLVSIAVLGSAAGLGCGPAAARPKNVVILIGDGMGFEHLKAAGLYANGREGSLFMESLPYKGRVRTTSVPPANLKPGSQHVTDSAAAGTAMATGRKVYNGVLSVASPGDGQPYTTVLESFAAQGKMTGIVSTAYITDATPAAFGAHASARGGRAEIVSCYLKTVRPNLILGGGDSDKKANLKPEVIEAAGYEVITNKAQLAGLKAGPGCHVFGLFANSNMPYEAQKAAAATQPDRAALLDAPSLSEMAAAVLPIVSAEPKGFFLMLEGALIDKSAHKHDLALCLPEVVEFDKTASLVMEWARKRKDTLVIVTADHETGGLQVVRGNGRGQLPEVTWSSTGHTNADVPLFAWGVGAKRVVGRLDNTDIYRLMMGTFEGSTADAPVSPPEPAAAAR